ncbi:hypothetical protein STAS_10779 [Striga asiatica]|uniref:Uncharacterized protein n=1 Tax=Striga asiatica TaxID=4170 RepID=A0A5A7PPH2_STRAF|nr:hypothetical protein STAS_10779 [Striga asiatica]
MVYCQMEREPYESPVFGSDNYNDDRTSDRVPSRSPCEKSLNDGVASCIGQSAESHLVCQILAEPRKLEARRLHPQVYARQPGKPHRINRISLTHIGDGPVITQGRISKNNRERWIIQFPFCYGTNFQAPDWTVYNYLDLLVCVIQSTQIIHVIFGPDVVNKPWVHRP